MSLRQLNMFNADHYLVNIFIFFRIHLSAQLFYLVILYLAGFCTLFYKMRSEYTRQVPGKRKLEIRFIDTVESTTNDTEILQKELLCRGFGVKPVKTPRRLSHPVKVYTSIILIF